MQKTTQIEFFLILVFVYNVKNFFYQTLVTILEPLQSPKRLAPISCLKQYQIFALITNFINKQINIIILTQFNM